MSHSSTSLGPRAHATCTITCISIVVQKARKSQLSGVKCTKHNAFYIIIIIRIKWCREYCRHASYKYNSLEIIEIIVIIISSSSRLAFNILKESLLHLPSLFSILEYFIIIIIIIKIEIIIRVHNMVQQ